MLNHYAFTLKLATLFANCQSEAWHCKQLMIQIHVSAFSYFNYNRSHHDLITLSHTAILILFRYIVQPYYIIYFQIYSSDSSIVNSEIN